jgi:hypothetical protein
MAASKRQGRRWRRRPGEPSFWALGGSHISMRKLGSPECFAKNLYAATAAILGILLWGAALLDWAGYTRFVLSLRWF